MKVHVYSIPWHCSTWTFNFPSHCSVCISTLLPFFRAQKSSTTSKMPRGRPRSHCHSWCGTVDGNKSESVKSRLFDKLQGFIHPEWIGRISSVIFVVFFFSLGDYQAWPKWLIQRHKRQNIHDAEALAIKGSAHHVGQVQRGLMFFSCDSQRNWRKPVQKKRPPPIPKKVMALFNMIVLLVLLGVVSGVPVYLFPFRNPF